MARTFQISKNMKTKIFVLVVLAAAAGSMARLVGSFSSWNQLVEQSPNIVIALCGKPVSPNPNVVVDNGPVSDSEVEIISTLKGTNQIVSSQLWTDHELVPNEIYLLFGRYDSGIYQAYEEYRVVPLGRQFSTNSIAGKPLDDQLHILFQAAVNNLNREIQKDEEEKGRLESGLKK